MIDANEVEKIIGVRLDDWQKEMIDNSNSINFNANRKRSGRGLVMIIKFLLQVGHPYSLPKKSMLLDKNKVYAINYFELMVDCYEKLKAEGIPVRMLKNTEEYEREGNK